LLFMPSTAALDTCYDCRSNPPLPDSDVCQRCVDLADELEREEKYCRDEHGGPRYCGCAQACAAAIALRAIALRAIDKQRYAAEVR
jgi:hypothetical protein